MAAAVAVLVIVGVPTFPGAPTRWVPAVLVFNAVAALVLLARHRYPFVVLPSVIALLAASVPLDLFNPGLAVAAAIAIYSVTVRTPQWRGVAITVVVALTAFAASVLAGQTAPQHGLVVLLGGAIGHGVRVQRAHFAAITERAERAERTRDALARQRVAEDRLAIARDLHDVVAHQIAVINLHAGVATSAVRTRPSDAESSLGIIARASRTVLSEIGALLATLRNPDNAETAAAGLAHLDDVVRDFRSLGMDVTTRVDGQPRQLPGAADVTALRVIQEALTNAHKHGADHRAHVFVEYLPQQVRLTIANPISRVPGGGRTGTGHGLTGMSERVESVSGTLRYGLDGTGTWMLVADLPAAAEPSTPVSAPEVAP